MLHVEFEEWKKNFERESCSYFVKSSGNKISGSSKRSYFYCNRSGTFQTRGKGKRMIKSQGSSKLDTYCTASIQLSYQPGGSIKAIINKTHYGHTCSLGHTLKNSVLFLHAHECRMIVPSNDIHTGMSICKCVDSTHFQLLISAHTHVLLFESVSQPYNNRMT